MANENTNPTPAKRFTMPTLPAMPSKGKNRPIHACQCGCGMGTKSTWYPGHDGRATGWAVRLERGLMTIDAVPANERKGAMFMLRRRNENPEALMAASEWISAEFKKADKTSKAS